MEIKWERQNWRGRKCEPFGCSSTQVFVLIHAKLNRSPTPLKRGWKNGQAEKNQWSEREMKKSNWNFLWEMPKTMERKIKSKHDVKKKTWRKTIAKGEKLKWAKINGKQTYWSNRNKKKKYEGGEEVKNMKPNEQRYNWTSNCGNYVAAAGKMWINTTIVSRFDNEKR